MNLLKRLISLAREKKENITLFIQFTLIAVLFFGLGVLYKQNNTIYEKNLIVGQNEQITATVSQFSKQIKDLQIENTPILKSNKNTETIQNKKFLFVASKSGKTYYKISCKNRIKDSNKIYFENEEDAQKTGLRRSKTCFK